MTLDDDTFQYTILVEVSTYVNHVLEEEEEEVLIMGYGVITSALYLTLATAMNFVAVLWSVVIIRLWSRPPTNQDQQNWWVNMGRCICTKQSSKLCDCPAVEIQQNGESGIITRKVLPCYWHIMLDCVDSVLFGLFLVYLAVSILVTLVIIPFQRHSQEDMFDQLKLSSDNVYMI